MTPKVTKKSRFLWLGNRPSLDFLNTVPVIDGTVVELLDTPEALGHWLAEAQVFPSGCPPRLLSARALAEARRLREGVRTVMTALAAGKAVPPDTVALLNALTNRPTRRAQVEVTRTGPRLRESWVVEEPADLIRPLAHDALHLLAGPEARLVRRCENPACVLFFLDTSKSHRRRWCSMATCGNRAKVAEFRARNA